MNFGKKLKKIRKSLNITQLELANEMEVSQRTISHYEKDESHPDIITLCRLAHAFNMSVEHLMGYDASKDEGAFKELRATTLAYIERRRKYDEELRAKIEAGRF